MLYQMIQEMEHAKLLDDETSSIVRKGSIVTLSAVLLLGGATLFSAGVVSTANFLKNGAPPKKDAKKTGYGFDDDEGIL